jgi:hypothetical protein
MDDIISVIYTIIRRSTFKTKRDDGFLSEGT